MGHIHAELTAKFDYDGEADRLVFKPGAGLWFSQDLAPAPFLSGIQALQVSDRMNELQAELVNGDSEVLILSRSAVSALRQLFAVWHNGYAYELAEAAEHFIDALIYGGQSFERD